MKFLLSPDGDGGGTAVIDSPAPATTSVPAGEQPKFFDAFDATDFGGDTRPGTPDPKPEPKPDATPAPVKEKKEAAPATDLTKEKPGKTDGIKEVREAHQRAVGELKSEREARQKIEARIAEFEAKGKDTAALAERLAKVEKERDERIAEVRGLRQEMSPEFKAKYEAPFNQAAAHAKNVIESMEIEVKDEEGNVTGTRKADWTKDFVRLFHMPPGLALREARKIFGDDADVIRGRLDTLWGMDAAKNAAAQDERTNFAENEKTRQAREATERNAVETMWQEANKSIADKDPEWFGSDQKDPKEKELLTKGLATVDSRHTQGMSLQDRVLLDAQVRNRAAAFGLAKHRVGVLKARVAELESTIDQMKGSRPGGGGQRPAGLGATEVNGQRPKSLLEDFNESVTGA